MSGLLTYPVTYYALNSLRYLRPDTIRSIGKGLHYGYKAYQGFKKYGIPAATAYKALKVQSKMPMYRKRKRGNSKPKPYKKAKTGKKKTASKNSNNIVTRQHDISVKRGKKRMSYRTRRAKAFSRKVKKALVYNSSTHFLLVSSGKGIINTEADAHKQVVLPSNGTGLNNFRLGIYPNGQTEEMDKLIWEFEGSGAPGNPPVGALKDAAGWTYGTSTWPTNVRMLDDDIFVNNEFKITGMKMTIVLRNPEGPTAFRPAIIDIYEVVNKIDFEQSSLATAYNAFSTLYTKSLDPSSHNGAGTWSRIAYTDAGATPYNCPTFGKYWKVLKHTKVEIHGQDQVSYTMTGPNLKFKEEDLLGGANRYRAGWIKDLLIIVSPTFGESHVADTPIMHWEWTKSYHFKMPKYKGQQQIAAHYEVN